MIDGSSAPSPISTPTDRHPAVFTSRLSSCVSSPPVDQSMFENSVAQQQSPQSFRPGQTSARRSPAAVHPNLGSSAVDSPSSGGQQRLKNAINLGKAVGAKVSTVKGSVKLQVHLLLVQSTRDPRAPQLFYPRRNQRWQKYSVKVWIQKKDKKKNILW